MTSNVLPSLMNASAGKDITSYFSIASVAFAVSILMNLIDACSVAKSLRIFSCNLQFPHDRLKNFKIVFPVAISSCNIACVISFMQIS